MVFGAQHLAGVPVARVAFLFYPGQMTEQEAIDEVNKQFGLSDGALRSCTPDLGKYKFCARLNDNVTLIFNVMSSGMFDVSLENEAIVAQNDGAFEDKRPSPPPRF